MKKYESVIITKVDLKEEVINKIITKVTDLINSNGSMEKVEQIGKKKLAYSVRNNTEGYYIIFEFTTLEEQIRELERYFRITEEILKFIVVRKDN